MPKLDQAEWPPSTQDLTPSSACAEREAKVLVGAHVGTHRPCQGRGRILPPRHGWSLMDLNLRVAETWFPLGSFGDRSGQRCPEQRRHTHMLFGLEFWLDCNGSKILIVPFRDPAVASEAQTGVRRLSGRTGHALGFFLDA